MTYLFINDQLLFTIREFANHLSIDILPALTHDWNNDLKYQHNMKDSLAAFVTSASTSLIMIVVAILRQTGSTTINFSCETGS